MRLSARSDRWLRITPVVALSIMVMIFLIVCLSMQRWYALGKVGRMDACADFDSMPPVSRMDREQSSVVLIGDSRIAEWPSDAFGEYAQILNWGVPGATVPEIFCGLKKYPHWRGADAYVLQVGINDLVAINALHRWFPGRREEAIHQTSHALTNLVNLIAGSGHQVIFLETLPPYRLDILRGFLWGPHVSDSANTLNQMQMMFSYPSNVRYLALMPLFMDGETRRWREGYSRDALHWQPVAYRAIEAKIHEAK